VVDYKGRNRKQWVKLIEWYLNHSKPSNEFWDPRRSTKCEADITTVLRSKGKIKPIRKNNFASKLYQIICRKWNKGAIVIDFSLCKYLLDSIIIDRA
jgi:hypothetical protein